MLCPCLNTEHIGICSGTAAPHIPSIERMERYCFRDGFVSCAIYQQQLGLPGSAESEPDLGAESRRGTHPVSAGAARSRGAHARGASPQRRSPRRREPIFAGKQGRRKSIRLGMTV